MIYETIKQAGYEYIRMADSGTHILKNIHSGEFEVWACNKNHASYGIIYKNTHLEFAHTLDN